HRPNRTSTDVRWEGPPGPPLRARISSEVPFAFFLFHRGGFVRVDKASLAFGSGRLTHLGNDVVERVGLRLDRAGQRKAAEGAEAYAQHLGCFARQQRQAV